MEGLSKARDPGWKKSASLRGVQVAVRMVTVEGSFDRRYRAFDLHIHSIA